MSLSCWCGEIRLVPYAENYCLCCSCKSLVSSYYAGGSKEHVTEVLADFYDTRYWQQKMLSIYAGMGISSLDAIISLHYHERAAYWARAILKYRQPPASFLEIGCGMGTLAFLGRQLGFEVCATEMDEEWCRWLKKKFTLPVVTPDTLSEQGNRKFDVIAAMDVLEHIADPVMFMKQVVTRLDDDGILVIQMPNFPYEEAADDSGKLASVFKELLLPDEHVFLYSKDAARQLMRQAGLEYIYHEQALFAGDQFFMASRKPLKATSSEMLLSEFFAKPDTIIPYALLESFTAYSEIVSKWQASERASMELNAACTHLNAVMAEKNAFFTQMQESFADLQRSNTALQEKLNRRSYRLLGKLLSLIGRE